LDFIPWHRFAPIDVTDGTRYQMRAGPLIYALQIQKDLSLRSNE